MVKSIRNPISGETYDSLEGFCALKTNNNYNKHAGLKYGQSQTKLRI